MGEKTAITTAATVLEAEGARIGLVSCMICGAALMLDPRETVDVLELHRRWHERLEQFVTARPGWCCRKAQDGRTVYIPEDPYTKANVPVFIDGEQVEVLRVDRLRDGGTTKIRTEVGTIVVHMRLGEPDRGRVTIAP